MERHSGPGWVVGYLRQLPNTVVTKDLNSDHLSIELAPGGSFDFHVIPYAYLSTSEARHLSDTLDSYGTPSELIPLLAVRRLTKEARQRLSEQGVSWVEEATGVVNLCGPGLYVNTRVNVPSSNRIEKARQTRLRGLAGRCAETLLLRERQQNILTTATLADEANVSAAMASYVLQRLAREEIVVAHGTGRRDRTWEILNRTLLLDLWKNEERLTQARVTTAYVWASTPTELLSRLTNLNQRERPWAIGGSAAANLYAPILTAEPVLKIWLSERETVEEALESVQGHPVTGGHNVEVYQIRDDPWALHATALIKPPTGNSVRISWSVVDQTTTDSAALRLVSKPRAYVETCYTATGRDMEVAEALRRKMHLDDI